MMLDVNFDIDVAERSLVGRGKDNGGGSSCLSSCCCCTGSRAELPADGFLDDRG